MNPLYSLQDGYQCDLCKTTVADSYCDFCLVNLCKQCIGEHVLDEYDNHKVVPFQHRKSILIYPKCGTHQHKKCELQCTDCNTFVCSSCMTSDLHKGHSFLEISELDKTKREIIEKNLEILENLIFPSYEEVALQLENDLANVDKEYERITTEMSKQGEELHREIDIFIDTMKHRINLTKEDHKDILQDHLHELKQTQSLIKRTCVTLTSIEKSTEVSTTIENSSEIIDFSQPLPRIKVCLPQFIPSALDRAKLRSVFGEITPLSIASATKKDIFNM